MIITSVHQFQDWFTTTHTLLELAKCEFTVTSDSFQWLTPTHQTPLVSINPVGVGVMTTHGWTLVDNDADAFSYVRDMMEFLAIPIPDIDAPPGYEPTEPPPKGRFIDV